MSIFPYGLYTGGWRLDDPIGERPFFSVLNTACWEGTPAQEEWWVLAWWIDGLGTKHRYSTILYTEAEQCYTNPQPSIDNLVLLGDDAFTYDGSELWTGASPYETVIRFPDGSVIEFAENPTFRTANGNFVSRGSNGLPIQDTLGRVIGFETNKADPALEYYKRYTVSDANGSPQIYTLHYVDSVQVWRPTDWYRGWTTINDVLTRIDLPGGQSYSFEYNHPQGLLTKLTLPTGGTISYGYPASDPYAFGNDYVISRTISDGATSHTWQFSRTSNAPGAERDVTVTYPEGNRVVHRFNATGLEVETRHLEPWGNAEQTVTTTWYGGFPSSVTTMREYLERETRYAYTTSPNYGLVLSQVEEIEWHVVGSSGPVVSRTKHSWSWPVTGVPFQRLDATEVWGVNPEKGQFELQGKTEYFYDQFGLATTHNVPNKGTVASFRGNLTTLRLWSGPSSYVEERYEYDDLGNMLRHVDPLGHATLFSYTDNFSDGINRNSYAYLTQATNAAGHSVRTAYDSSTGLPTRLTDPRGLYTLYAYDAQNRPSSITHPNGRVQSWFYDAVNRGITETTGASGYTTETYLDKFSRPMRTVQIDPAGGNIYVDTEYDGNGRVKRVSEPYRSGVPRWTTTLYDTLDRKIQENGPDGNPISQYSYFQNTVDDGGRTLLYDALGRLSEVRVDTTQTVYSYYVFGALHRVSGQTRTFVHDWLGRKTHETHPESGTTSYQYDAASRRILRSDARGVTTAYTYDTIDRLLSVRYSGGAATPSVTYTYDQNGHTGLRTEMQDGVGRVSYAYNAAAQIVSEQHTFNGITGSYTASYLYDAEGRPTKVTYPSGRAVNYSYQPGTSRLNVIEDQTTGAPVLSSVVDNALGQVTSVTLGNGVVRSHAFNGLSQLENMSARRGASTLMNFTYGYADGRVATRTDGVQPEHSVQYAYDRLKRLQSIAGTAVNWSISWQFDEWGNRTQQSPTGLAAGRVGTQSIGYANNRVVNPAWVYDAAGNVTYDGTLHYYYDAENRLIQIDSPSIQYAYDGEGRRARKTVGGTTTYFVYGQLGLMSEFSTNSFLSSASGAVATDRLRYRIGEPTGTAVLVMDSSGAVRENNRTLPYGEPWTQAPPSLSANALKFTTYQHDDESGQEYAMARYYAGRMGRFLTPDPGLTGAELSDPQSWNAYAYTANDPVNRIDESGTNYTVCVWDSGAGCYDLEDADYEALYNDPGAGIKMPDPTTKEGFVGWIIGYREYAGFVRYYLSNSQRFGMAMSERTDASNQMLLVLMGGSTGIGSGAALAPVATGVVARGAATVVGRAYAATGGSGVVLGAYEGYPNYIDAARAMNANAFNIRVWIWTILKFMGEDWTANRAFLDASIKRGQQFYLNTPPLGATGTFARELQYLTSRGIDATKWLMVRRPF
jgi:RHS repeat-associated protein